MKISLKILSLGLCLVFSLLAAPQVNAQKRGSSDASASVLKGKDAFILSGLKMSPQDQKALLKLAQNNPKAFKISVNSGKSSKSYGKMANSEMRIKQVLKANGGTTTQASATCHSVSTDVQCVSINSVVGVTGLNSSARNQINSLMKKYMR
ncbi:MAG: hypothetical protein Sapg2KO_45710 [Saprospiraceae bacterium]